MFYFVRCFIYFLFSLDSLELYTDGISTFFFGGEGYKFVVFSMVPLVFLIRYLVLLGVWNNHLQTALWSLFWTKILLVFLCFQIWGDFILTLALVYLSPFHLCFFPMQLLSCRLYQFGGLWPMTIDEHGQWPVQIQTLYPFSLEYWRHDGKKIKTRCGYINTKTMITSRDFQTSRENLFYSLLMHLQYITISILVRIAP